MKKEKEKQNNSEEVKPAPCYGGAQCRWTYDKYLEEMAAKNKKNDKTVNVIGIVITVVFIIALVSILAVFIVDAVLRANGTTLAGIFKEEGMTSSEVAEVGFQSTVKVCVGTSDGERAVSGTVYREDGYILTSASALAGEKSITVETDGKTYAASVVSVNDRYNLAVLKIDAEGLKIFRQGSCCELNAGTLVLITGMTSSSASDGIGVIPCSVTNARVSLGLSDLFINNSALTSSDGEEDSVPMIQLNALISDSTLGSPLLNMNGEIIGFIAFRTEDGIGYAVPMNTEMLNVLTLMVDVRNVTELSAVVQTIPSENIDKYKLSCGCRVLSLDKDGAAAKAGIKVDDTIISVNGVDIYTALQLEQALSGQTSFTLKVCSGSVCREVTIDEQ